MKIIFSYSIFYVLSLTTAQSFLLPVCMHFKCVLQTHIFFSLFVKLEICATVGLNRETAADQRSAVFADMLD